MSPDERSLPESFAIGVEPPMVTETTSPWWEATRERRLLVQCCSRCGERQHYPRPFCLACGGEALGWIEASGEAVVWSKTVVHRPARPGLAVPYVVALVRLAEGPVLLSRVVGPGALEVRCDEPVELDFEPLADGRALPVFRRRSPD
jgi:uncharacterized OB-fold protein